MSKENSKITSFIFGFKKIIRFIVSIFASREMGFIYCLTGTITQIAHTYFLTSSISSLEGNWKIAQAVMLSAFISSSLLYFVVISDNEKTKESRRIHIAINIFTFIEIMINMYYYSRHLIIDSKEMQVFDFIFALLISCLIPVTLKLYAGLIQAKSWFDEFAEGREIGNKNSQQIVQQDPALLFDSIRESVKEYVGELVGDLKKDLKTDVTIDENQLQQIIEKRITETEVPANVEKTIKGIIDRADISSEIGSTKIKALVKDTFFGEMEKYKQSIDGQVSEAFKKNSEIFLKDFESKLKAIVNSKG